MPNNEPSLFDQWQETYKTLAVEFDATISDRTNEITHIYNAQLAIIDLDSSDFGREASTQLLGPINLLYRHARQHYSYDPWRDGTVRSINDFTIKHYGDLATFVNSLSWEDGCVPFYWANLSENVRFDISEWIVCEENPS